MLVRLFFAPFYLYRDLHRDYAALAKRIETREEIENALSNLSDIWEKGTHLRNDITKKNPPSQADVDQVAAMEEKIDANVAVVAKSEVGLFRTINQFDITKHAVAFQHHPFLLNFSERLARLKPFIERHQSRY